MPARRNPSLGQEGAGPLTPAVNPDVVLLSDFLMSPKYSDGTNREPGSITLFFEGGRVKVAFNEKTDRMVGFGLVEDLAELSACLELLLQGDKVDWRQAKGRR
jgi:hypothetical protein